MQAVSRPPEKLVMDSANYCLLWNENYKSAEYLTQVVDLRTGAVQSFKTKALFLSHHANAWEVDDNTIVADGVFYPSDAVTIFSSKLYS